MSAFVRYYNKAVSVTVGSGGRGQTGSIGDDMKQIDKDLERAVPNALNGAEVSAAMQRVLCAFAFRCGEKGVGGYEQGVLTRCASHRYQECTL